MGPLQIRRNFRMQLQPGQNGFHWILDTIVHVECAKAPSSWPCPVMCKLPALQLSNINSECQSFDWMGWGKLQWNCENEGQTEPLLAGQKETEWPYFAQSLENSGLTDLLQRNTREWTGEISHRGQQPEVKKTKSLPKVSIDSSRSWPE